MKVAIWIDDKMDPSIGGGYSYFTSLVNEIDNFEFDSSLDIVFIYNSESKIETNKNQINLGEKKVIIPYWIKLLIFFLTTVDRFRILLPRVINSKKKLVNDQYVEHIKNDNISIIYYLRQCESRIDNFPFISTNWDLGHISMYAFPEVNMNNSFEGRKYWYENYLPKSQLIFVESQSGKKETEQYLPVNPDRVKVVPMFAPNLLNSINISEQEASELLQKRNLIPNKFFFYPAQFWAHKNHYNLIKAFELFSNKISEKFFLVLTGADKGNLDYIKEVIALTTISDRVIITGFVSEQEILVYYKNAASLVMPTFLGPTNIPLLEARQLRCPIICSDIKGHKEILGNGAIYIDSKDYQSICDAMIKVIDGTTRSKLQKEALIEEENSCFKSSKAIESIQKHLIDYQSVRRTWGNNFNIF